MIDIHREDQKLYTRGVVPSTIHSRVARSASASNCNLFQLTHLPRGTHAQSIASNGDEKEDKTLLQHSQLPQHGVFRHVSVRERQRLWLCGQDLCGAFVRLYWQPTSKRAIEQWRPTAQQKRLYLHHQGEFQHQNCTVGTVHDSDHEGVLRIFVRHSHHSNELFTLITLFTRHNFSYTSSVITRHNFSYTRSVTRGNRTPGSRNANGCNSLVAQATR